MREFIAEALELVAYVLGTGGLVVAGVFAEWSSLSYFTDGNLMFAAWLAVIGAVALYAAFSLGTDRLLPHLRGETAE